MLAENSKTISTDVADAAEEERCGDREAGDQRHQEGGAEHGHHMLGAEPEHLAPTEAFIRGDNCPGLQSAVAVQRP